MGLSGQKRRGLSKLMSIFSILFAVRDTWFGTVVNIHQTVHLQSMLVILYKAQIEKKLSFVVTENVLKFKFLPF